MQSVVAKLITLDGIIEHFFFIYNIHKLKKMIELKIIQLNEHCIVWYVPTLFCVESVFRNTIMFILEIIEIKCYN
jgi:hypothetical protein